MMTFFYLNIFGQINSSDSKSLTSEINATDFLMISIYHGCERYERQEINENFKKLELEKQTKPKKDIAEEVKNTKKKGRRI